MGAFHPKLSSPAALELSRLESLLLIDSNNSNPTSSSPHSDPHFWGKPASQLALCLIDDGWITREKDYLGVALVSENAKL